MTVKSCADTWERISFPLYSTHFDMKTESGTMKTHASDTLSPAVSVPPLSVTRLNCSARNTHTVSVITQISL